MYMYDARTYDIVHSKRFTKVVELFVIRFLSCSTKSIAKPVCAQVQIRLKDKM